MLFVFTGVFVIAGFVIAGFVKAGFVIAGYHCTWAILLERDEKNRTSLSPQPYIVGIRRCKLTEAINCCFYK